MAQSSEIYLADIIDLEQLQGVHRAHNALEVVEQEFGEDIQTILHELIEGDRFDVTLSVHGLYTALRATERRSDGVLLGIIPEDKAYETVMTPANELLKYNGAALEAGIGNSKRLEIRYSDGQPESTGFIEDTDSYLRP